MLALSYRRRIGRLSLWIMMEVEVWKRRGGLMWMSLWRDFEFGSGRMAFGRREF
jgi:hypothetical protein